MGERSLPTPKNSTVEITEFQSLSATRVSCTDREKMIEIQKYFISVGVLDRPLIPFEKQTDEQLNTIISEAVAAAKSEKELNPDYYSEELDEMLDNIDDNGFENEMIDNY